MNRHERRKAAAEDRRVNVAIDRVIIRKGGLAALDASSDAYAMIMACIRAGMHIPEGSMSDEDAFDGTAELIERGFLTMLIHHAPRHVGVEVSLLDPDTGVVMSSEYTIAIELMSVQ